MTTVTIRRLADAHVAGVIALLEGTLEPAAAAEMLASDIGAGRAREAVALVAEDEAGRVVGFVNTEPHDDFDDGDDEHVDADSLEIRYLLAVTGNADMRAELLRRLLPAVEVRGFARVYRRVHASELAAFESAGWQLLPPGYGIAWNDPADPAKVFLQLPAVGEQISVYETGTGSPGWTYPIPDDLDQLGQHIRAARDFAYQRRD